MIINRWDLTVNTVLASDRVPLPLPLKSIQLLLISLFETNNFLHSN